MRRKENKELQMYTVACSSLYFDFDGHKLVMNVLVCCERWTKWARFDRDERNDRNQHWSLCDDAPVDVPERMAYLLAQIPNIRPRDPSILADTKKALSIVFRQPLPG